MIWRIIDPRHDNRRICIVSICWHGLIHHLGVVRGEHHSLGRLVVVRFTGKRIGPGHDNRILDVRRIKLVKNVRNYESLL